jgi:murein DD-endopeptidase MepM/ murein hydrolase activator NlpD
MIAGIVRLWNAVIGALEAIAAIATIKDYIPSIPLPDFNGDTKTGTPVDNTTGSKPTPPAQKAPSGKRSLITIPETINARFWSNGSPAWKNQPGGYHYGTDFGAPHGSAVFAPYDMTVVKIGYYEDAGRMGHYIIGTLTDGTEYYTGHLQNVTVKSGDFVKSGVKLGETNVYNHTHVQLRQNGKLIDFEEYSK